TCRYWLQPLLFNAWVSAASDDKCWCSSKSKICGPKAGRVMFWLATAPTPARSHGQRAPTAMLEELMAIPSWPVSGQRPMMEKVMYSSLQSGGRRPVIGDNGDHINFHQPLRLPERGDHQAG